MTLQLTDRLDPNSPESPSIGLTPIVGQRSISPQPELVSVPGTAQLIPIVFPMEVESSSLTAEYWTRLTQGQL